MWYFKPVVDKIRDGHSVGTVDKIARTEVFFFVDEIVKIEPFSRHFFFLFEKS